MNVVVGKLPDQLASEYVLGTLSKGARRRFEALLPAHPALQQAVVTWEERFLSMGLSIPTANPSPKAWKGIERRLGWLKASSPSRLRMRMWQGIAGLATAAAIAFGVFPPQAETGAPVVVVLQSSQGDASLVAGLSQDRRQLSVTPLHKVSLTENQSLELWAVPETGAPHSLGLVSGEHPTAIRKGAFPADTKKLAVSLEPQGGSTTGHPTGPILFVGALAL